MKELLDRVEVPGAEAAGGRVREVVLAAFATREPVVPQRRGRLILVTVTVIVAAAAAAAVLSPPGRAVIDRVREVVGVERAEPALFSLPAPGRLLVVSDAGLWVVQQDGSRRLLGAYREASWSPFGRFVVATRPNELTALEPDGDVRWSLARPGAGDPAWAGTRTDTRIAYADTSGVRVVAGDGSGDRLVAAAATGPVAWRPGSRSQLAFVTGREARVIDVDTRRVVWKAPRAGGGAVRALEWSSDGRRLLVVQPAALRIYDTRGRLVGRDDPSDGTQDIDGAFRPGTHEVAVIRAHGTQSTVLSLGTGTPLFSGTGALDQVIWSPDGRRLLVTWPTADQWVFVAAGGPRRLTAAANVSAQFRTQAVPEVAGWCCTAGAP